jgi:radical SAM protein with 4Fe4S-binding SPASM domain
MPSTADEQPGVEALSPVACPAGESPAGRALHARALADHIPLSGSIDLTRRCGLACRHCYVADRSVPDAGAASELSTAELLDLLEAITKSGCLFLLMTGGDPLIRPDFATVYRHARELGLVVSVFTNATTLRPEVVEVLAELPPYHVEVSLYGATEPTSLAVTGVPGALARALHGIEALLAAGVTVRLKTMLLRSNAHELPGLQAIALGLGVRFRIDPLVFARLSGDRAPLAERLEADHAVALELGDPDRLAEWRRFHARFGTPPPLDARYECSAGRTLFHVDAEGLLRPCVMVREPAYDLRGGDFATGWRTVIPRLFELKTAAARPCGTCDQRAICGYCPALLDLEGVPGDEAAPFLCALGAARLRIIAGSGACTGMDHEH